MYPEALKISKAIPLLKYGKNPTCPLSYRAVNLLPALSKIVDRIVAEQITEFLLLNDVIPTQHHGGVKTKSTITAIMSVIDDWTEKVEKGEDLAVIVIDQSAAYDTIDHPILLEKMDAVGFNDSTLRYFKSYLNNRRQSIHMEGDVSDELHIGDMSVVQGSTLSCLLYLLYTLDLPLLFNESKLTTEEQLTNKEPTSTTYVDDTMTTITLNKDDNKQTQINTTVDKLMDYMNANLLTMNQDKTQLMIISKNPNTKTNLQINTQTKTILPTSNFKYLGILIKDDLKWNLHLRDSKDSLVKQMTTRISSIKLLKKYLNTKTLTKLATGLIYSKMALWDGDMGSSTKLPHKDHQHYTNESSKSCGWKWILQMEQP